MVHFDTPSSLGIFCLKLNIFCIKVNKRNNKNLTDTHSSSHAFTWHAHYCFDSKINKKKIRVDEDYSSSHL
jgi:hypothetical protein